MPPQKFVAIAAQVYLKRTTWYLQDNVSVPLFHLQSSSSMSQFDQGNDRQKLNGKQFIFLLTNKRLLTIHYVYPLIGLLGGTTWKIFTSNCSKVIIHIAKPACSASMYAFKIDVGYRLNVSIFESTR
jgi:hypothetical protein